MVAAGSKDPEHSRLAERERIQRGELYNLSIIFITKLLRKAKEESVGQNTLKLLTAVGQ